MDINFNEEDGQDFIIELPTGTLEAPVDILVEPGGTAFPVLETPLIVDNGGGGDIFIIND